MRNIIKKTLLYGTLSLSLLTSGCTSKKNTNQVDFNKIKLIQDKNNASKFKTDEVITTNYKTNLDLKDNDVVRIPDDYISYVKCSTNMDKEAFTVNDLSKILTLDIMVTDQDLSWVNYCTNLKNLSLNYISNSDVSKYINVLPSLSNCSIKSASDTLIEIEEHRFKFLKEANSLSIGNNVVIDEEYISNTNIKELSIVSGIESRIDYKKLSFLDSLKIDIDNKYPYNSSIYFTTEDMNYLHEQGVSIEVGNEVLEINKKLDEINKSLEIDYLEKDIEKYKKITSYVINNLEYGDPTKANLYYNKGLLYAPLNYDEGICGNYAGLVEALSLRNGLDCYVVDSGHKGQHAWNLININGFYYYTDLTMLDALMGMEDTTTTDINNYVKYLGYYPFLFDERTTPKDVMYDIIQYPMDYRIYMDENALIQKSPVYKNTNK